MSCKATTIKGEACKRTAKVEGLCAQHHAIEVRRQGARAASVEVIERATAAAEDYRRQYGRSWSDTATKWTPDLADAIELDDDDADHWGPLVNGLHFYPDTAEATPESKGSPGFVLREGWVKRDADQWDAWGRQAVAFDPRTDADEVARVLRAMADWANGYADADAERASTDVEVPADLFRQVDDDERRRRSAEFRAKVSAWVKRAPEGRKLTRVGRFLPGDRTIQAHRQMRAEVEVGRRAADDPEWVELERKRSSMVRVFVPKVRTERPCLSSERWSRVFGEHGDRNVIVVTDPTEGGRWFVLDCFRESITTPERWEALSGRRPARRFTERLANGATRFQAPTLMVPAAMVGPFDIEVDAIDCAERYASQVALDLRMDSDGHGVDPREATTDPDLLGFLRRLAERQGDGPEVDGGPDLGW